MIVVREVGSEEQRFVLRVLFVILLTHPLQLQVAFELVVLVDFELVALAFLVVAFELAFLLVELLGNFVVIVVVLELVVVFEV